MNCGACKLKFSNVEMLSKHLKYCPEASCLLPLIHVVAFGGDKMGHPLSHFVWGAFPKAVKLNLIKRYAYAVADDLNIMDRAKLHQDLCDTLGFEYKKFRPFESSSIVKTMNRKEALEYLCQNIFMEAHKLK